MSKPGFVYILSNKNRTTLYIGVTSDLERRLAEHRTGVFDSFTKRYNLFDLLYFEYFADIKDAIDRETVIKKWSRAKKDALMASTNPLLKSIEL
jgi:putative endonuclease